MLPDELHVWICLLDDTIAQLFSNDQHVVKMCSALLKPYMNYSLSGQITSDLLESLRVTTHNTIRFVAQAGPFANPKNEQDNELLLKQIGFMNRTSLEGRMSFEDYRDLIEVFAQYWRKRSEAIDGFLTKLSGESSKQHVEEIQSLLLKCMAEALDKRVEMVELVNFCRVYEEFLSYLHNLPMECVDREDPGVRKHLAQVLTGQGKSLVLAMVAAVLALCGHSVQVMCYSEYLTTRDWKDFEDFYGYFGVRSKITNLNNNKLLREKKVVKDHYHINEMSVMPSFFGGSNLKFNATQDFRCLKTVNEWMNAIFGRINTMINAKRSVLVVFDTDLKVEAFKQQFAALLDRLNVLTVNTNLTNKERFINDAGVSRTITLATREMGRGVDYKSSVAVEKNGGMHVIQSFFSVDVKEETQIKGRTARKDNRGSYELIMKGTPNTVPHLLTPRLNLDGLGEHS
ncbi:hypothetical protein quinque_004881 [Culex quinquefasciatus]